MTADLHASAYLVDAADLAAAGVELTHDGGGLWAGLAEDVSTLTSPGADGGVPLGSGFRPFTQSTMYTVRGTSFADVWTKIRALRRACKPGQTITLTRRMPDPEGTDTNVDTTTTARRLVDRIEWFGATAAAVDVDWLVTDPPWHGPSSTIASAAGTQSILGDTRTRRMTITFNAGTGRTLTNTTTGHWFTFGTAVPTGGVIIDVEARTATAITGGADMSNWLTWGKADLFQLNPGPNVITLNNGSASISYKPAYL